MAIQSWAAISGAADRVEQYLQADSKFKKLSELLRATPHQPSLSGLQDIDYPNMLTHKIPLISNVTTVPLPSEVIEQFINMQQNCALGIFPQISRAWLSVDSSVFFWAYDNASDVAYYDGLKETILAVHLFKPKQGVFKPHIKYLLCLVTALEITLLGVTCSEEETVLLIPDPLFKISTDNVTFSVLAGAESGRVFMGGNDGCLYEIVYQADEGWFSRKCRKINHSHSILSYVTPSFLNFSEQEPILQIEIDDTRHLLYTRSDKSSIQMYDLGNDGLSMRHVTTKNLSTVVNQASCIARTIDTSNFQPIIGIKAISRTESETIHLVAVTQAGVRLYFSACGGDRPMSLDLVHVRLPPGFTPSSAMQRPKEVGNIYLKDNTFIMTSTQTENKDFLWVLNNDFYVYEEQMMEAFSINSLNGRVWCIAEEVKPSIFRGHELEKPPLVVTQQFEERRKFILLTSDGVHIFHKQRPIDQLQHLLQECQGFEATPVMSFFQSTKLTEACVTSLILASSSNLPQEKQLVEWATLALYRYGCDSRHLEGATRHLDSGLRPLNGDTRHYDSAPRQLNGDTHHINGDTRHSLNPRHDAIYLYLSRLVRPIWLLKAAATQTIENHKFLVNTASIEEISLCLKRLMELKKFLDLNIQISQELERDSLSSLLRLLGRCIEVLNLYKLLYEHQFSTVCTNLPAEPQSKLSLMTFRDLIVVGNEMTINIASALVRRYLEDNITTDAISRRLHELCPSIFRQENALQAKAHEMILQSRAIIDKIDKERMMNEAVGLLKKIGVRLDLQAVCDLLHSARAHKYIVDLCLFVAEKRDPLNLAGVHQSRLIDEGEERSRATALSHRMDCYMRIIDTLDRLLSTEDFNEVFVSCVQSSDELFHTKLYEWLCEKNLSSRLLEVQSPYVETFLKKKAESDLHLSYMDLLWRYYERRGNFLGAAQILDKLAGKPCADYGLDERLEYLSRAKGCVEALATPGEYLHELEEKMEVVKIQIQIFKRMKELDSPTAQEAASRLNYSLMDLTQLYQDYAQKFHLFDCQLAILKCGNHNDPILIEKLWKNIIDQVLHKNSREPLDTQLQILGNLIETLGRNLMPSERFFPLYYIIAYLEFKTHTYNNIDWVTRCLMRIGFKPISLLDPYHKFYKSREHSIYWQGKSVHVLYVIAHLIDQSLGRCDRTFATACLDVICDYLIDLQTMAGEDVKRLQEIFTNLQTKINQMLN